VFFVTEDWYFCSHRLVLGAAARAAGYEVVVVTRVQNHGPRITAAGLRLVPLQLSRRSKNPFTELAAVWRVCKIYRQEKPDLVHHVALKPVIYGSLAAWFTRCPVVVNALAGMGFLFSSRTKTARVLRPVVLNLFRLLLGRPNSCVIVQNDDDKALLSGARIATPEHIAVIRGSGVDIEQFTVRSDPSEPVIVVLVARMLWDKGIGEFVDAAGHLRSQGVTARFVLVGAIDDENPAAIPEATLRGWVDAGIVEWWGQRDDISDILAASHIACLPSYREGLPKSLLEAAASGRAIVTTDVPGCREIVRDGENGRLVPARNATALASALRELITDADKRHRMGRRGRQRVEQEFADKKVVAQTLKLYERLLL
jgi:glycosyltransferase involved in cell wall biosynthesis